MRTIAIEEHFLAEGFREAMKSNASLAGGNLNTAYMREVLLFAASQEKLADLGAFRLKDMDAGGIDLQVISHTVSGIASLPGDESVKLAREANDQLAAAVATHPDRFAGFATLPMTEPGAAVDELERAVRSLGFKGALINGTTNGRFLDDPSFLPILERAVALNVPIYVHPALPPAAVWEAYYSGLAPEMNLALATGGWGWHSEVGIHALRLILAGCSTACRPCRLSLGIWGR